MHISKAVLASALALTVAAAPLQGSQGTGGTDSAIVLNLCAELESYDRDQGGSRQPCSPEWREYGNELSKLAGCKTDAKANVAQGYRDDEYRGDEDKYGNRGRYGDDKDGYGNDKGGHGNGKDGYGNGKDGYGNDKNGYGDDKNDNGNKDGYGGSRNGNNQDGYGDDKGQYGEECKDQNQGGHKGEYDEEKNCKKGDH